MLEWIGLALGVAGLTPSVVIAVDQMRARLPLRRILQLRSKQGVEILVTTSGSGVSDVGPPEGPRAKRDLVPSGDLAGVVEICSMLARVYPRKAFVITPSSRTQEDRRRDQILIGGPVHNRYSARIVCGRMSEATPETPIVFDADNRYVKVGDRQLGPGLDLKFDDDIPRTEYSIVILTGIRRYGTSQRVVITGGMTTYGTHAASHFIAHELARFVASRRLGSAPNVCILLKAALVNGQPYDIDVLHHIPIAHLGTWS
ncbi:MAG TPA: hypothetical protein VLJ59_02445 [Mycobacteriales bacterium]|nr:hypothetical protein [Mycobacteriales bacterium]